MLLALREIDRYGTMSIYQGMLLDKELSLTP